MKLFFLADYKKRKLLAQHIEELEIRVCTYNFLKKHNITEIEQLFQVDWKTVLSVETKAQLIMEDLSDFIQFGEGSSYTFKTTNHAR